MTSIYFRPGFERGFGTWPLKGDELRASLEAALEAGYRAIDTAQLYGNEAEVGAVLNASGIARDELCVTTKVDPAHFGEDDFIASVERSVEALGGAPDVLLLHWPPEDMAIEAPLERLAEARRRGLTREIGVSNFTRAMLVRAGEVIGDPIACNQIEFHPLIDQSAMLAAATETGIPLTAYCALARGKFTDHPEFAAIGEAHGKSAAQIVSRWILQKGVAVNAMSTKERNIRANFDVMDFTLSSIEMARIDALGATGYRIVATGPYGIAPDWD